MCGINGIFAYRDAAPPVDEAELLRVREAMAKRGPDGAGLWISPDRRVGLAHRRLTIIDLSDAGAQPMATADRRLHITFNGEIYNYKVLRKELEQKGFVFRSQSDTEVLLHLYVDRGADMVHALRGMYAFGIWDAHEQVLFLARDPFGIKPLYYSDDGRTARFASQVKALLAVGGLACTPDPAGHVGFFLFGAVPDPHTLYRQIRALPAGCTMLVRMGGAEPPRRFFSIGEAYLAAREHVPTRENAEQAFRTTLSDSLRAHLVADVEVGLFLSSGVDSTVIAQLASGAGATMRALTLGFREFDNKSDDEVPLAQHSAKTLGFIHEIGWIDRKDFEADIAAVLHAMDQPSIDGINTYFVSKLAARLGLKVALSGLGGDELFVGYSSFREVPALAHYIARFPARSMAGPAVRRMAAPLVAWLGKPKLAGLVEYGGTLPGAYLLRRALYMPWELGTVMDPDLARSGLEELHILDRLAGIASPQLDEIQFISCLETGWYMRNQLLRDSDWAGMAHSLEIRVPFVDVPLLRAVAACRAAGVSVNKTFLVSGFPRDPVAATAQRKKTGFSIPVPRWASEIPNVQPPVRDYRGWARYLYGSFAGGAAGVRRGPDSQVAA